MKIYIDDRERYTDFTVSISKQNKFNKEFDVDAETVAHWQKVIEAYNIVQSEIDDMIEQRYNNIHGYS